MSRPKTPSAWPGFLLICPLLPLPVPAQEGPPELDTIQVTATRVAEPLSRIPASVTVVSGEELRARGAYGLQAALAGLAGIEISPGGDNGPAGSVPAFWGLREFDAFLLVVDGVPSGGAFNPALTTLDLTNVERIEVMRGSAPVMYGATSFVGVIHVIHYPAGESEQRAWLGAGGVAGNPGSATAGYAARLGDAGTWSQSLSGNLERTAFADGEAGIARGHLLYRAGGGWRDGRAWFDADASLVNQQPDSPVVLEGSSLSTATPLDANHNPSDARFQERRLQLNLGGSVPAGDAAWESLASLAATHVDLVRGYLEDPGNPAPNADGYGQERRVYDLYLDSHVAADAGTSLDAVFGADLLFGGAKAETRVFEYAVSLDGGQRGSSSTATQLKAGEGEGERLFGGVYAQFDWRATETIDVLAGLRLNATREKREGEKEEDTDNDGVPEEVAATEEERLLRLTGMVGASARLWESGPDRVALFADWRNSFKPAAFEFGPEVEAAIPRAETANSAEAGIKSTVLGGRLSIEAAWFQQDFRNVFLLEGNDIRRTRLRGAELELDWTPRDALVLRSSYAWHDAQFVEGTINGGGDDVSGNRLELSPRQLASFGVLLNPRQGLYGGAMWHYTGERFLDRRNSARTPAYQTVDVSLGYRIARYSVSLSGSNLTDRRDPVSASEFSEVLAGSSAYYRLPARALMLNAAISL